MTIFFILSALVTLVLLIVFLILAVEANVNFYCNVTDMVARAKLSWGGAVLNADYIYTPGVQTTTVKLFNIKVYNKNQESKNQNKDKDKPKAMDVLKSLSLSDVNIRTSYGFFSPFATGVTYIITNIISQYINIDSIEQNADFVPDEDYVYIDGTCNLNIGLTLINLNRLYNGSKSQLTYQTSKGG